MPKLALTIGDPLGIGPEITAKALQRLNEFPDLSLIIIGRLSALKQATTTCRLTLPDNEQVRYIDIDAALPGTVAYHSIEAAVQLIKRGEADALVTGPISKKHLQEAGYDFPGHTEILEMLARRDFNTPDARAEMLFAFKNFRLLLLTRHIALRDVSAALAQRGAVARPLKTLIHFLRHQAGIEEPRIALLGVNPHAGEMCGDDEAKLFKPIIDAVNAIGNTRLEGCLPADAFFRGFDPATTPYDAIVAAYHDQGLIAFKLLAGFEAVNITIGLPFLRTSVGHGTAEDIVGKGIAREDGFIAALHTAMDIVSPNKQPL